MNLDAIEPLKKLGIALVHCDGQQAIFSLPLKGNQNDKLTLFAGSQYSALVIAGWYLASYWAEQNNLGDKVAIKYGQVRYPKAAVDDVTVKARFVTEPEKRPSGHWRADILIEAFDTKDELVSELIGDYRILQ